MHERKLTSPVPVADADGPATPEAGSRADVSEQPVVDEGGAVTQEPAKPKSDVDIDAGERTQPTRPVDREAVDAIAGDGALPPARTGYSFSHILRQIAMGLCLAAFVWLGTMFVLVVTYRFFNPPFSALMVIRMFEGHQVNQRWVSLGNISPNLVRAVVSSEDSRFCQHWGIDPEAVEAAIRRARNGTPRGASTITMQLSKNLFLWPDKSYFRKALEVPITLMIEAIWPKWRIAEVYLNVVEWGKGIYGADAAARHHFRTRARKLDKRQAALLAVSLPNPILRRAGKPSRLMTRMGRTIEARMRGLGRAADCVLKR